MSMENPFCTAGKEVIATETQAIQALTERVDQNFVNACQVMLECKGRVVVIGMGKSGHIGGKIAATLASTGTPAFFVHPGEASHGDMGMITPRDVVLAISNSGETPEILTLLPIIKRLGTPLIALLGNVQSTLARTADATIDVSVANEAGPLGLAPTASTTATLVMGDALAIALLQARDFTSNDFALFHPGGILGRRLLLRIEDIMHTGEAIPTVRENCPLGEALVEITQKSLGMTAVVDEDGFLKGVFTDGDLRRALDQGINIHQTDIQKVMTKGCITIPPSLLAAEGLKIMQQNKITSLVVVNEKQLPLGVIHMHDLLRAGVQ